MPTHPPERIVGERVVVRRYAPHDAAALVRSETESLEHLRPWMPWIRHEPQTVEQRVEMIETWTKEWDEATNFVYTMVDPADESRIIGGTGLHLRNGPDEIEIGYWVHIDHVGRGVATESARLLTTAGLALDGKEAVLICHDRANRASGAVPRKLGYRLVEEYSRPNEAPAETGIHHKWRVTAAEWIALG